MGKETQTPKKGIARLLEIAAIKKPLVITSAVLSALASVASFIPSQVRARRPIQF
ncbi:hypothetical protein SDC9_147118 [bioreactor metagenome]|uniref:Uncharacterized protein n=1 Tax=bioreactor metagenome TaxID=1076179 RepID=A0A645EGP2_9ZZZZ